MPSIKTLLEAVPDDAGIKGCYDNCEVGGASFHPAACQPGHQGPFRFVRSHQEPGSQLTCSLAAPFPHPTSRWPQAWSLGSKSQEGKCHFLLIVCSLSFSGLSGLTLAQNFNTHRWSMFSKEMMKHFQVSNHFSSLHWGWFSFEKIT